MSTSATKTMSTEAQKSNTTNNKNNGYHHVDVYTCQHGGPGELVVADKRLFCLSYEHSRIAARKAQGFAQYQEILATELVVLESLIKKNESLRKLIDGDLMKLYFGLATSHLLQAQLEKARVHARMGVYLAMYLKHGDTLWELMQLEPSVQQMVLEDMYVALGQIALDAGLPRLLNRQAPCTCLEHAFPALKGKN